MSPVMESAFSRSTFQSSSQTSSNKFRVLVIEDDAPVARLVLLNLTRVGLQAHHAPDGHSGCDAFEEIRPHLLLVDLGLPGLHGFDVCARIRHQSSVPIIILTASDDGKDQMRGLKLGADDYVTKPFNPQLLLARILVQLRRTYNSPAAPTPDEQREIEQREAARQKLMQTRTSEMLRAMPLGWANCDSCSYIGPLDNFEKQRENHDRDTLLCPQCVTSERPAFATC